MKTDSTVTMREYFAPDSAVVEVSVEQCIAASVEAILGDMENNELLREDF